MSDTYDNNDPESDTPDGKEIKKVDARIISTVRNLKSGRKSSHKPFGINHIENDKNFEE